MSTGNHHEHDNEHDDLAALQRAWHTASLDEPPTEVDVAVLRKARAAVAEKPSRAWPWTARWTRWLATGSVAAVAATVLLHLHGEAPSPTAPPLAAPPPSPVAEPSPSPAAAAARAQNAPAASAEEGFAPAARDSDATLKTLHRVAPRRENTAPDASADASAEVREREFLGDALILEEQAEAADTAPERAGNQVELPPAEWLRQIADLHAAGDPAWREELARFQRQWPDYPVPDSLIAEIAQPEP